MSLFSYNGIKFPYAYTLQFRQEPVYDDMGGTDWYCTKFDIALQAVIHHNYVPVMSAALLREDFKSSTQNPADIMNAIRFRLLKPRKTLSLVVNGVEMIPNVSVGFAGPGTVDVQNGPKPQSCSIMQLNSAAFLITYHIIAHYWENTRVTTPGGSPLIVNMQGNNVLFNRWTDSIEMNNCNYVTRAKEGKFIIRSDNRDGKIAFECIPQMAIVAIPRGFLRESGSYAVSPDGLAIQYRVVDKEQYKMPPAPAYEADGDYTESTSKSDGKRFGSVQVRLKGSKIVTQAKLIEVASAVAARKLHLAGAPLIGVADNLRGILQSASITQRMYANEVHANMVAMFPATPQRLNDIAGMTAAIATTPFSDGVVINPPPVIFAFGTASRLVQAAAYYDPSLRATVYNKETGQLSTGLEVGRAGQRLET